MPDTDELIQHVYAYFLKAYQQGATEAPGGEIVAFEPMGFSPGCVTLPGNSTALEEVSQLADVLPQVDGGIYTHTGRTVSVQYGSMIDAAQPSAGTSIASFSDLKSLASKLYQDASSDGELDGPKATYATPVDWYDLDRAANWSHYSYDAAATVAVATPSTLAPNVHLTWRVVSQPTHAEMRRAPIKVGGMPALLPPRAVGLISSSAASIVSVRSIEPAQLRTADFVPRAAVARVAVETTPKPVESRTFTISFDYCLVRLRRPWLSGDFLAMPGWYIPGARSGDYATGSAANPGWFNALPTAFIAIKSLLISGSWSANDLAAAGTSAALGPFSLLGTSATNQGSLSNPGLQIIAWICSPQLRMPPDSDPALVLPETT